MTVSDLCNVKNEKVKTKFGVPLLENISARIKMCWKRKVLCVKIGKAPNCQVSELPDWI